MCYINGLKTSTSSNRSDTDGYYFTRTLGRRRIRPEESIEFLACLLHRSGSGSSIIRSSVDCSRARVGRETRLQSRHTAGVFDPSICASSVQCHPQLHRLPRRVSLDSVSPETAALGTRSLGSPCADRRAHPFICVLPDAHPVASLQLEVRRLAVDNSNHPHSQFCPVGYGLCLVLSKPL